MILLLRRRFQETGSFFGFFLATTLFKTLPFRVSKAIFREKSTCGFPDGVDCKEMILES